MSNYIQATKTLFDICEEYPETIAVFASNGFPQMEDATQREQFGKMITLDAALQLKGLNRETFTKLLNDVITDNRESSDATLQQKKEVDTSAEALDIVGLLPCPVRIPLLEAYNSFAEEYEKSHGVTLNTELKAASVGTQWVEQNIDNTESIDELPDLFISAGFDLFFDEKRIGKYRNAGEFTDLLKWKGENGTFAGEQLQDPQGNYSIISVVPAVFMVNSNELGDRKMPESWEDILQPEFEGTVSLPVGDFDLFNAILLSIHDRFGDEGVKKLAKSMLLSMHPAQMVKSDRAKHARPIVTIMPYFFTKTVREGSVMKAIWPKDGAVLSPIFMLAKKKRAEALQPVVDFFSSVEAGEILAHKGLFPSLNPEVDNRIEGETPFMWLGWEKILAKDLSKEIAYCEELFNSSIENQE